jgi:hypothetical protein
LVALWFALGHVHQTWPVWTQPLRLIAGQHGDNLVMVWNLAHMRDSVRAGTAGFHSSSLFFPEGFHFLYSTHFWLDGLLSALALGLVGATSEASLILAYNWIQLLSTVLSGVLCWWGLRVWGVRGAALRLAIATAVVLSGFRLFAATGHQHFHSTHWMVGCLVAAGYWRLALARGRSQSMIGWALATGLIAGCTLLNDATLGIFLLSLLGPGLVLIIAGALRTDRGRPRIPRALMTVALGGILAAGLALIHLIPIRDAVRQGLVDTTVPALDQERITDLTSLLLPSDVHPWRQEWWRHLRRTLHLRTTTRPYLGTGFILLVLLAGSAAGVGLFGRLGRLGGSCQVTAAARPIPALAVPTSRDVPIPLGFKGRTALASGLLGLTFLLFACGDRWTVGSKSAGFRSPAVILHSVPIVNNIRMPYRWQWPALLGLGLAVGLVLERTRWPTGRWIRPTLLIGIAAISMGESRYAPYPTTDWPTDPILNPPGLMQAVARLPKDASVAVVPAWDMFRPMRWQVGWGLSVPLASGYVARIPPHGRNPARTPVWTPEVEEWFRKRRVGTLLITAADPLNTWTDFATSATRALPHLRVIRESDFHDPWHGEGSGFDASLIP